MSKRVGTPRFYVDIPSFLTATGYFRNDGGELQSEKLLFGNASNPVVRTVDNDFLATNGYFTFHKIGDHDYGKVSFPINFAALLNHNYGYFAHGNGSGGQPASTTYGEREDYIGGITEDDNSDFYDPFSDVPDVVPTPFSREHKHLYFNAKRSNPGNQMAETVTLNNSRNILNADPENLSQNDSLSFSPAYNGTSIFEFPTRYGVWSSFGVGLMAEEWENGVSGDLQIFTTDSGASLGSMFVGRYYDCPVTPDLTLTMERRFEGISSTTTLGGKTLSNIFYDGPTEWTMYGHEIEHVDGVDTDVATTWKYPPFELDSPHHPRVQVRASGNFDLSDEYFRYRAKSGLGRKGLRSWNLTFSYVDEDDTFIAYESSNVAPFEPNESFSSITETAVPQDGNRLISSFGTNALNNPVTPMLSDNSFNFVINATMMGTIPFIFQPNNENNNPDQFSLCQFKEDSYSVEQVAFNTYKVSLTIEEIA